MFRGYRKYLFHKDITNKNINTLSHVNTCSKCLKLNPCLQSPALNNIQNCMYCGNPFYIIKCGIK